LGEVTRSYGRFETVEEARTTVGPERAQLVIAGSTEWFLD
jgi:hypothetical protein